MWRRKKFIIVGVLAAVLLVGSIGGVALAQTENGDDTQPETLLARVADILGIDQQTLEDAFAQAQTEMRDEALDNYLDNLVNEGTITQEQADQYRAWHQARPDMEPFRQQLREWEQARPDMPLPDRFGGRCFPDGMKWGGGRHFWGR
jgi:hypothetical protein